MREEDTDFFLKDKFKTGMGKKIQGGDVLMLPDGWQDGRARMARCWGPPPV